MHLHKGERLGLGCELFFLSLPWLWKPIEASVSKLFEVSFNKFFGRFHFGEVGFCETH